jgi:FMN-dependent NADH-azoreductase
MRIRLLNIEASPRGAQSVSIALSRAFLEAFLASNPEAEIDTLNVWDADLPEFDQQGIGAKYKGVSQEPMNDAEMRVWESIQSLARRFRTADRILLGVPMWNFAYPYKLKQLIDLACQRDFLFTFDGKTYGPLVRTQKAFCIFVRGQSEEAGFGALRSPGFEHQTRYLEFWLRFIGVREVTSMTVEHTWDSQASDTVTHAKAQATAAAACF